MPTTAENRRPSPEERPPPGSHFVCRGDVAPWLPHRAGWQEIGLLGHSQPACKAGGAAWLFLCPMLVWQAQPEGFCAFSFELGQALPIPHRAGNSMGALA